MLHWEASQDCLSANNFYWPVSTRRLIRTFGQSRKGSNNVVGVIVVAVPELH
jgi:hypothetical protein